MKNKKLFLIGLIIFVVGILNKLVFCVSNSVNLTIIDITLFTLPLITAVLLLIKPKSKLSVIFNSVSSLIFLLFVLIGFFTPELPQHLSFSFLGYLKTYLTYISPLLKSGYLISAIGAILMIINGIKSIEFSTKTDN